MQHDIMFHVIKTPFKTVNELPYNPVVLTETKYD